jgi:hypothetical protein
MVYVSITGFRLRAFWHLPRFTWLALAAMAQARRADGNVSAEGYFANGVYHTLSVWTNRPAMVAYLTSGTHRRAMRIFPAIGTGFGFGFETDSPPRVEAVPVLWVEEERRRGLADKPDPGLRSPLDIGGSPP